MKHYHLIGIGGAGMAPLAQLLIQRGEAVTGSDLERNAKCDELSAMGAVVFIGHRRENLPENAEVVIYSSAVPENNPEFSAARERGLALYRRGEFLAQYASLYRRVAAVSGSHGKSSVTTQLVMILRACGKLPGFMIGAAVEGLPSCGKGEGDDIFVTEADESDGTHTLLKSFLGIVPNIEDDHAWSVGGREQLEANFKTFSAHSQILLYYASPLCDRLFANHPHAVRLAKAPETWGGLHGFQAANAYLAFQAALCLGCPENTAGKAAEKPPHVLRRLTVRRETPGVVIIEDYAHHPTEVRRSMEWLRQCYPGYHLRILIQPHRYARLERYFDEFAAVLSKADSLFVTPVFAAWSETGRFSGRDLAEAAGGIYLPGPWQKTAEALCRDLPPKTVIAVLGAGDIQEVFRYL